MIVLRAALQLPDHLACGIDHATGTGKSYVMYGLARIMLAAGAVDHVLVLCPSNTIEAGLLDEFRGLSRDKGLKDLLPPDSVRANPHIIDATETITAGAVCIENIHATYAGTRSAIRDSLMGKGKRTLVLNDEAHHIYTPSDAGLRKWKEFLLDPDFGFRYVVGLSGTCYIGNEYFTDVVARYSLHQAMEYGAVKRIEYVAEDAAGDQIEQFQKIYANHRENAVKRYRKVRPLTILVTKDIPRCTRLTDKLVDFLANAEDIPKAEAARKVLCVTSANEHRRNVDRLRAGEPDDPGSPIEWITSVSMLTEGWDVHNVFQIVPHEERAFNSKLLIAQVLGRGLRVPLPYRARPPPGDRVQPCSVGRRHQASCGRGDGRTRRESHPFPSRRQRTTTSSCIRSTTARLSGSSRSVRTRSTTSARSPSWSLKQTSCRERQPTSMRSVASDGRRRPESTWTWFR